MPEAREVVYRLMPHVDVVVINYRPDVAGHLVSLRHRAVHQL